MNSLTWRIVTLQTLAVVLLIAFCNEARAKAIVIQGRVTNPQDAENDSTFEQKQTANLLGVQVQSFPPPQGMAGFDELPRNAPVFRFSLKERRQSGPPPRVSYEVRKIVEALAPDGSLYEAYCGYDDPYEITPGHGFVSTFENRRQRYDPHHGYGYQPQDVFIGKRAAGLIKSTLFFRDVGSHTTAPHHLAIDSHGWVHLAVADVNISQNNRLDLYWVIGDPNSGKWNAAWLIDRRGFTSWSYPWSAAWRDKVHLVWSWCDVSINKRAPGMGAFHVEWSPNGFGRKVRVISGPVNMLDAAIDPDSGRLVIVMAKDDGIHIISRSANGAWTRPSRLHPSLIRNTDISIQSTTGGAFVVRTGSEDTREWVLRPTLISK